MAASIYATPPPDLSGEDTALSDVSNNSAASLSSHNNHSSGGNNNNGSGSKNSTGAHLSGSGSNASSRGSTSNSGDDGGSDQGTATAATPTESTTAATTPTAAAAPKTRSQKRSIADVLTSAHISADSATHTSPIPAADVSAVAADLAAAAAAATTQAPNASAAIAAVAAAANAAMQLQLLEAMNDAAKKRRKQDKPNRLGGSGALNLKARQAVPATDEEEDDNGHNDDADGDEVDEREDSGDSTLPTDYEERLTKMFLPKSMEQLKETFELLQQQQQQQQQRQEQDSEASVATEERARSELRRGEQPRSISPKVEHHDENDMDMGTDEDGIASRVDALMRSPTAENMAAMQAEMAASAAAEHDPKNPYHTFCKKCGENFEDEFKLSVHMLQEHGVGRSAGGGADGNRENEENEDANKPPQTPFDILASVKVKLERPDYENSASPPQTSGGQGPTDADGPETSGGASNGLVGALRSGKEPWMSAVPGMGFPFPAEAAAAAALNAGGYLPLLGVPGFGGVDGLNRPPLRIFNPEAYCDLCNKEFCNKYFLKTHKANKHGIYDPAGPATSAQGDTGSQMNQMFQLQMQQQHQQMQQQLQLQQQQHKQQQLELQQQQQHEPPPPPPPPPAPPQRESRSKHSSAGAVPPAGALSMPQQAGAVAAAPTAPPQPVFCDICSKRFTNIFAMRRHRAKIHEQPAPASDRHASGTRGSPNGPSASATKADAGGAAHHQPQHHHHHHHHHQHHDTKAEAKNGGGNEMAAQQQFQMPEGFQQDFSLEQEEVTFTPQPRKLSPQMQQQARDANFAHDKLRRLGVLNPDTFCELCCKEYCNKYFLRTHKWKRHGIFVPPDDLKDDQLLSQSLAHKMPWPFMGMPAMAAMPLNLMMANEKAVVAQRMLAAAAAANASAAADETGHQLLKRIKLELPDDGMLGMGGELHRQDVKMAAVEQQLAVGPRLSLPSTPEPQKGLAESLANLPPSPEAAMGLQNLQKLQSMIQQLNDLNGKRPVGCHLCGREMENQYALQGHIMAEHSGLPPDMTSPFPLNFQQHLLQQHQLQQQVQQQQHQQQQQQQQQEQQTLKLSPSEPIASELRCHQCDRDFSSLPEFKQHIAEMHLLPSSPLREGFVTPERPTNANNASATSGGAVAAAAAGGAAAAGANGANRPPYTITPTSSYCEICNKELCNKYFMKTHMQRMHGIEIENGAQIGGVVCNICNKELCSKYFLRVHKHNTHGIVEEGAPLPQPRQNGANAEAQQQAQQQQQQQPQPPPQPPPQPVADSEPGRGLNLSPFAGNSAGGGGSGGSAGVSGGNSRTNDAKGTDSADARYYASYTEVCPVCARRFRSPKWLRTHLLNDHGSAGLEKLREIEQQQQQPVQPPPSGIGERGSKPTSPTLKIPNGNSTPSLAGVASLVPSPANLAQALQNLNAQHLLGNMPKNMLPGMLGAMTEQALQSPRFKEYQCSMCPFTTPYYAFLFIHERSHSLLNNVPLVESGLPMSGQDHHAYGGSNGGDNVHESSSSSNDGDVVKSESAISLVREKSRKLPAGRGTRVKNHTPAINAPPSPRTPHCSPTPSPRPGSEPANLSTRTPTPNDVAALPHNQAFIDSSDNYREADSPQPAAAVNMKLRSIATSPKINWYNSLPQDLLREIANRTGKPASFALPQGASKYINGEEEEEYSSSQQSLHQDPQFQAFIVEEVREGCSRRREDDLEDGEAGNRFVPAIIYLPVRERIANAMTVSFNLTPA